MKVPLQQLGYEQSQYERPNQKWVCGWLADGHPCDIGPDRRGRCPVEGQLECTPERTATGFRCTRPPAFGGACGPGPRPDGTCCKPVPVHPPCQPRLSLRARRNRLTFLVAVAAVGAVLLMIGGPWAPRFASPGPLLAAHATLRSSVATDHNCAVCHEAIPPSDSAAAVTPVIASIGPAQSDQCITCHFVAAPEGRSTAKLPHGAALTAAPEPHQPRDLSAHSIAAGLGFARQRDAEIGCAVCHREHQGLQATIIPTDTACHACHGGQFTGFTSGHPAFSHASARAGIAFDHAAHAREDHFGQRRFDCAACHRLDATGRAMTIAPYEQACAACHSAGQEDHHGRQIRDIPPITIFTMPDPEDYDAQPGLPPLMSLLLAGNAELRPILDAMKPDTVFADLDDEPKQLLLDEAKQLQEQLAKPDATALRTRLAVATGNSLDPATLESLTRSLTDPSITRTDSQVVQPVTGHADPFLTAWLSAGAAPAAPATLKSLAESAKTCLRCHTPQAGQINWVSSGRQDMPWSYQKFNHRTHLAAAGSQSCATCHAMGSTTDTTNSRSPHGLLGYTTVQCAACHNPRTSNDSCLTCHDYHLHRP